MFLRRCACVEPSDPTNDTLKYWARTNVTASEIYWEALEVKVHPSLEPDAECKNGTEIQRRIETLCRRPRLMLLIVHPEIDSVVVPP